MAGSGCAVNFRGLVYSGVRVVLSRAPGLTRNARVSSIGVMDIAHLEEKS